jgi:hypothetical protein
MDKNLAWIICVFIKNVTVPIVMPASVFSEMNSLLFLVPDLSSRPIPGFTVIS